MAEAFKDFSKSTLVSGIAANATSITVTDGTDFPAADFYIVIDSNNSKREIIHIASRTDNVLTADAWGVDGTAAQSHDVQASVIHGMLARHAQAFSDGLADLSAETTARIDGDATLDNRLDVIEGANLDTRVTDVEATLPNKADLVGGVVPTSQMPAITILNRVSVVDEAARLALTNPGDVQVGDVAIQADTGTTWLLVDADPSLAASWKAVDQSDIVQSVNNQTGTVVLGKGDVGLGNVDNTSDANKPVSAATQTALDTKQPLDSDLTAIAALTPTDNDVVQRKAGAWTNRTPAQVKTDLALAKGDVGLGNVDNTSDANKPISTATQTALNTKAPVASPALTGTPTTPTPAAGDDTTKIANTQFVQSEISSADKSVRQDSMAVIKHGLNPAVARPVDAPAAYWIGDTEPLLAREEDLVRLEKNLLTGDDLLLKEATALWDTRTHDGTELLKDLSGNGHHLQMGSTHVARLMGEEGILLPGQTGKYASAPDRAEYDITGDIDIRVKVALGNWTPTGYPALVDKTTWVFQVGAGGTLRLAVQFGGTWRAAETGIILSDMSSGAVKWLRVSRRQSDGRVQFFISDDGTAWIKVGDDSSMNAGIAMDVGSSSLQVGMHATTSDTWSGFVYRAIVKNGIGDNAPVVFDADFTKAPEGATSFTEDALGATVTINGTTGADTNDPLFLSLAENEDPYLYLPGVNNNSVSTAIKTGLLTDTGVIEGTVDITPESWRPASAYTLTSKWVDGGTGTDWYFTLNTDGTLTIRLHDGTTGIFINSSVAIPADTTRRLVRFRYQRDTGAGQYGATFWYAAPGETDPDTATWTQLGSTRTGASLVATTDDSSPLGFSNINGGTYQQFSGRLYRQIVKKDGTLVADFDPSRSRQPHRNFIDSVGNVWTINRSTSGRKAALVDTPMFLFGTDDYMETPDHDNLDFGAGQNFTVLAAYRQFNTPNTQVFIGKLDSFGGAVPGWGLYGGSTWRGGAVASAATAVGANTATPITPHSGLGNLLAHTLRVNKATPLMESIVDTKVVAQNNNGTVIPADMSNSSPVRIGRSSGAGSEYADMEFIGAAIFRRALTDAEITKISRHFGWTPYQSLLDEAVVAAVPSVLDNGVGLVDITGRGHNFKLGSSAGVADTNDPLMLPYDGEKYAYLPGVAGNYISTPDVNLLDAGTAHMQTSMGKWVGGALSTDFPLFGTNGGKFTLAAGASVLVTSQEGTSGFPVTAGTQYSFQASLRINNARNAANYLAWYDSAGVLLSTSETVDRFAISTTGYTEFTHTATAPANAAFARLSIVVNDVVAGDILYIGRATLRTGSTATFVPSTRITGDIDLRAKVALDDWASGGWRTAVTKLGSNRGYRLAVTGDRLSLSWFQEDGTLIGAQSTAPSPFSPYEVGYIRGTIDIDNGSGIWVATFFTSSDGSTWTQLGATVTGANITNIGVNSALLVTGSNGTGTEAANGKVYQTEVRDGIDGPVVAEFKANNAAEPYSTYTAPNNVVWTFNRSASGRKLTVVDQNLLLFGVDDYAETPDDDELDFGASDSFTALVIKRFYGTQPVSGIFVKRSGGISPAGWGIGATSGGPDWVSLTDGTDQISKSSVSTNDVGKITSVGMIVDRSTQQLTSAKNGLIEAGTTALTNIDSVAGNYAMYIGGYGPAAYWEGEIVGVVLIRRALTAAELDQLATELINYNKSRDKRMLARKTLRPWKE